MNEWFLRLIIGKTKKRYISRITLREGNLMNPPKYDIKGFDFKKATCSEYAEERFMKIIKNHILNSDTIEIKSIIKEMREFKNEIETSIRKGERKFLPNAAAKDFNAYKNPESEQSVRGVLAWNMLFPNNQIELPSKVSMLKLNIFKPDDIKDLEKTNPNEYNIIMENIFNDKTGMFVEYKEKINKVEYVSLNQDGEWWKLIPEKYRTKYKKLGIKKWNEFVDDFDFDNPKYNPENTMERKDRGMACIAIPSNAEIPDWLQPYIDYSTMINNILSPFLPVSEIFGLQTISEGKTIGGVNRKTEAFTNIVKF